ncbi:MAG: AI-2E family transporter [Bacillota bacterium]|nr:AI-2E family transporter [Bacillota bacterium]
MEKFAALLIVAVLIFIFQGILDLLLFTFVFSFFLYIIQNFLYINLRKLIRVERKIVIAFVFLLVVALISFFLYKYIPVIITQFKEIVEELQEFDVNKLKGTIPQSVLDMVQKIDPKDYIQTGSSAAVKTITNIGKLGFDIFLSLILSFFFIIEKDEVVNFGRRIENSKLAGPFKSIKYFTRSFLNSFAKVMQAQILIAFINCVLSIIGLSIMGFPQVLGLGFMVFLLGLVPVAGVWVSLIPLSIIAIKISGVTLLIYVWGMIAVIHCLEAYVLNPKIMSMNTKLPVFLTFLILIVSEHLMGIWGLLFGIPIFMFLLDIFDIKVFKTPEEVKTVNK